MPDYLVVDAILTRAIAPVLSTLIGDAEPLSDDERERLRKQRLDEWIDRILQDADLSAEIVRRYRCKRYGHGYSE